MIKREITEIILVSSWIVYKPSLVKLSLTEYDCVKTLSNWINFKVSLERLKKYRQELSAML